MAETERSGRNVRGDSARAKRKRKGDQREDRAVEGRKGDDNAPPPPSSAQRQTSSSLLKGKLFAVSTLVEASSEESPEAYSQIISLCRDLGAQTTGQVHRRVTAVLATESAVAGNTQRVRKAWKKGILVVSPEWIQGCIRDGRLVDMGPFILKPKEASESRSTKGLQVSPKRSTLDLEKIKERQVDLGCCCVCHESQDGRTDCSWCLDCSVNRQHNKRDVTVDLGCCCVCHETERGRTDCDWCADCSVNQQFLAS